MNTVEISTTLVTTTTINLLTSIATCLLQILMIAFFRKNDTDLVAALGSYPCSC
jgi:hypothetical protein